MNTTLNHEETEPEPDVWQPIETAPVAPFKSAGGAEIALAYEAFAAAQKRLEPEFATILASNLWDLYAR